MSSRRTARVARAIQETVSTAILMELRDPRVKNVTVLKADVTEDLRYSKIYISVMGDGKTQSLTMKGLDSARGFLQSKVAKRLMTKVTPTLEFVLDPSVKLSLAAADRLRELFPEGIHRPGMDDVDDTEDGDEELDDDDEDLDDESDADLDLEEDDPDGTELTLSDPSLPDSSGEQRTAAADPVEENRADPRTEPPAV